MPLEECQHGTPEESTAMPEEQADKEKARSEPNGSGERSGGIKGILVSAGFTFLGGIIGVLGTGYYQLATQKEKSLSELALERQKFDSELVKTAIASDDEDKRLQFLEFMVKTHLILDKDIRDGVESYVKEVQENPKKSVPQFVPITLWGPRIVSLQSKLSQLGFYHSIIDGILGHATEAAIRDFQASKGLKVTGEADSDTLDALGLAPSGQ